MQNMQGNNSGRIYINVVPKLTELGIKHQVSKNENAVMFKLGEYFLHLSGRKSAGRYTLSIRSHTKTTEDALADFVNSRRSETKSDNSERKATIPSRELQEIFESLTKYVHKYGVQQSQTH